MKVKEFAESQGITTQAVYQRLKNASKKTGKQVSDYISVDTSEITEDGYKLLQTLYKQPIKQREKSKTVVSGQLNTLSTEIEKLKSLNQQLTIETEIQKERISSLETLIKEKDRRIDDLISDKQKAEQRIDQLTERIPTSRPGFFKRLLSGKTEQPKA